MTSSPRHWQIYIPVRPKAVQSARHTGKFVYVDPKVRKWKQEIEPYIKMACHGEPPSTLPIRAVALRYFYKLPKNAKKAIRKALEDGATIPYLAPADLTDNLSKGVVDVCKGIVFEDDSQIWHIAEAVKLYGIEDHIELEFEETPDVIVLK